MSTREPSMGMIASRPRPNGEGSVGLAVLNDIGRSEKQQDHDSAEFISTYQP